MKKSKRFILFYSFFAFVLLAVKWFFVTPHLDDKMGELFQERNLLKEQFIKPSFSEEAIKLHKENLTKESEKFHYIDEETYYEPLTEEELLFNQELEKKLITLEQQIVSFSKKEDWLFFSSIIVISPLLIAFNICFYLSLKDKDIKKPTKVILILILFFTFVYAVFLDFSIFIACNFLIFAIFTLSHNISKMIFFYLYGFFICLLPFYIEYA